MRAEEHEHEKRCDDHQRAHQEVVAQTLIALVGGARGAGRVEGGGGRRRRVRGVQSLARSERIGRQRRRGERRETENGEGDGCEQEAEELGGGNEQHDGHERRELVPLGQRRAPLDREAVRGAHAHAAQGEREHEQRLRVRHLREEREEQHTRRDASEQQLEAWHRRHLLVEPHGEEGAHEARDDQ